MEREPAQEQEIAQEQAPEQEGGVRTRRANVASIVATSGEKGMTPAAAMATRTAPSPPPPQVAQVNPAVVDPAMLQQLSSLLMQLISQVTANGHPAPAASSSTPPVAAIMPLPGTIAGSLQPPSGMHGVGCSGGAPPSQGQSSHHTTSSTSSENVVVMSKIKRDLFKH